MKTPKSKRKYEYKEMLTWEGRWEWINGIPYNMTPAPSTEHQRILGNLYFELRSFLQDSTCEPFIAPFDVRLSETDDYENPDHVVQPDVSVICKTERLDTRGSKGAPSLIIEILSPGTAIKDRNEKFKLYEKYGVTEYWIVDPAHQTLEVYGLEERAYRHREVFGRDDKLCSFLFPELATELSAIFP